MEHIGFFLKDINSHRKSGDLVFKRKNIKKYLSFQDGFLVFAKTNQPQELLEEVLYKLGKISDETYLRIDQYKSPNKNIDDILIAKKLLTPKGLHEAQMYQMREITLAIFPFFDGKFDFQEIKDLFGLKPKSKIRASVLIEDGIRRMKYDPLLKKLMESKIPFQTEKDFSFNLTEEEKRILGTIDGNSSSGDLLQSSNFKPYIFWKSLFMFYCLNLIDVKREEKVALKEEIDFISAVKVSLKDELEYMREEKDLKKEKIEVEKEEKIPEREEIDFRSAVKTSLKEEAPKEEAVPEKEEEAPKEEAVPEKEEEAPKEEAVPEKEEEAPKEEVVPEKEKKVTEEEVSVKREEAAPKENEIGIKKEERVPVEEEKAEEAIDDDSQIRLNEVLAMRENFKTMDHYKILNISRTASPNEIKSAFFELARKFHPDRFNRELPSDTKQTIEEVFSQITKAYHVLSSEEMRKQYDSQEGFPAEKGRKDLTKTAEIRFRQGKTLYSQGRYEEAQILLEEAIRLNRNKGSYYLLLAMTESKIPAFHRKAEEDFLKAQNLEPWNPEGFGGLGLLYKQVGLKAKARMQFKKALEIDPDYRIALKELRLGGKGDKKKGIKEILSYDLFGGKKKK